MLGTTFILDSLANEGINHLFMVPGGLIDPFLPALGSQNILTLIVATQEGGAAYMPAPFSLAAEILACTLIWHDVSENIQTEAINQGFDIT